MKKTTKHLLCETLETRRLLSFTAGSFSTSVLNEYSDAVYIPLAQHASGSSSIDANSVAIVSEPPHGLLVPVGGGTYAYSPVGNFIGNDIFTYTVANTAGQVSSRGTVTVMVEKPPAPIATNNLQYAPLGAGTIGTIRVRGTFAADVISAATINSASLGHINTNDAGTPFGVVIGTLGHLSAFAGKQAVNLNRAGLMVNRVFGDFQIVIDG